MNGLVELLVAGGSLPPSVLALRAGTTRSLQMEPIIYDLQFPSSQTPDDVERFLASLTGLLPPWWKRIVRQPVVGFEVVATAGSIRHRLIIPQSVHSYMDSALQAHLSGVRYEPQEDEVWQPTHAVEYRTTTDARPLRVAAEAVTSGLLTAMQPLGHSEKVVIQWLLTAGWPVRPARLAKAGERTIVADSELLNNAEAVTARRAKLRAPLLLAVGRIGAQAGTYERARHLVRRAEGPLHATRAPGVHFRRRAMPSQLVAERILHRTVPVTRFPALLNIEEAAAVIGWPMSGQIVPGLRTGGSRLLPVPGEVRQTGTVLGTASFPAQVGRPVALELEARYRHLAVTGPTGSGKSTLLAQIALQDLRAGHGLVCVDPKGDLTDRILERLPASRKGDVIVLDAGHGGPAVGYNPLSTASGDRETAVENVLGVMKRIWLASWGPRTDALLRACLSTLVQVGGMTICEVEPLLTDSAFRRSLLSRVTDRFGVEAAWACYDAWSDGEQIAAASPLLNKVQAITTRPRLRAIFGQVEGAVDFPRIIRDRKVLLVNLASGAIGVEAAHLLGALLFAGLWDAVSARAHLPAEKRAPVMALLDEFQHVVQLPTPAETILAEARSYKLGLTIAHQHLGQLPNDLRHAVLANARSRVVFQAAQEDAGAFARELGGGLTPDDLMGIPAFEAIVKVYAGGQVRPPTTIRTEDLARGNRSAADIRRASQQRWGMSREDVEEAIAERQQRHGESTPRVGRRRRSES